MARHCQSPNMGTRQILQKPLHLKKTPSPWLSSMHWTYMA